MNIKFSEIKIYIKNLFSDVQAVYNEKGAEPFKKPLVISLIVIIALYILYHSSSSRLSDIKDRIKWIESIKDYYNEYTSSKETIKRYSSKVAAWKDKDDFLNYTLTSIASKNGIAFSSLEAQKEMTFDRVYYVTKQVKFTTTYEKMIKFLAEIETSELFLEISQITISKKENPNQLGEVDVDLTLGTIFINL
ncbi:MAG: hypothetical protein ACP5PA_04055 [Elusimicrobiales bacterium]